MNKRYRKSLFLFRRDLRLFDNSGLIAALNQSEQVLAAFVLDPRQIQPHRYQSLPALQFMLETLSDLDRQLRERGGRLCLFKGHPLDVIESLRQEQHIDAVFVNRDYTPFSQRRDAELAQRCGELGLAFHSHADILLNEPERILSQNAVPYQVFTAFYQRSRQYPVALPTDLPCDARFTVCNDHSTALSELQTTTCHPIRGGRQIALELLASLSRCGNYAAERDYPALAATSDLSAHLKFGSCSVREAYYAVVRQLGEDHALLRQFYWRDFFSHIAFHFPKVFGHAFHDQYDAIAWRNNIDEFKRWTDGQTGFPIVDAGLRQLKQTACMHNRVRMIVASFLVKDLMISWRWGERYFAQHLLDYDPCLNNGNWQWAASTGCDAQPYFRIFNPWLQQQKFDPDCTYIKRWIPELRVYSATVIHHWHKKPLAGAYPAPMLDHAERSQQAKLLFQQAKQSQAGHDHAQL